MEKGEADRRPNILLPQARRLTMLTTSRSTISEGAETTRLQRTVAYLLLGAYLFRDGRTLSLTVLQAQNGAEVAANVLDEVDTEIMAAGFTTDELALEIRTSRRAAPFRRPFCFPIVQAYIEPGEAQMAPWQIWRRFFDRTDSWWVNPETGQAASRAKKMDPVWLCCEGTKSWLTWHIRPPRSLHVLQH